MSGRCLIGWEGAGSHMRCGALRSYYEGRVHFNQRGYEAAVALVELLQLNPKTALARDLDKLAVRFLCENCTPVDGGLKAYTWRECVCPFCPSLIPSLWGRCNVMEMLIFAFDRFCTTSIVY